MKKVRNEDGAAHFSNLKKFAQSPAHYKVSCETPYESTRAMRIGTAIHELVLGARVGKPLAVFNGDARRGTKWEDFEEENRGREILTRPEWAEAEIVAKAVLSDPLAAPFLRGRKEVALIWNEDEIACATGGVDVIGDGWIADLKSTDSTKPDKWQRRAFELLYHAQMAFYEKGCKANNIDTSKGLFLIGVESKAPFCVTVLRLTPEIIAHGHKCCSVWLEKLQACEDADEWPGYVQNVVDFELPSWMGAADEDAGDDAGEVALA